MGSNNVFNNPETRCAPTGFGTCDVPAMVERKAGDVVFWQGEHMDVPHGFSTRLGGVSEGIFTSLNLGHRRGDDPEKVRKNYEIFCEATQTDVNAIVMANQVHGNFVKRVSSEDVKEDLFSPAKFEADGLVTNTPGITLVIFSADCIPILFFDPAQKVIAAVHAGWRGTAQAIAAQGVRAMEELGSRPADIRCAIGPGIGPGCFETDEDVPEEMAKRLGNWTERYRKALGNGRFQVDLKGLNGEILRQAGILEQNLAVSGECTCCRHEKYWSHRFTKGQRGSQGAVIMLP